MLNTKKTCYTCLCFETEDLIDIEETGTEDVSYLNKLKFIVSSELEEMDTTKICKSCAKHIRIFSKFKKMVLQTQAVWAKQKNDEEMVFFETDNSLQTDITNSTDGEVCVSLKVLDETTNQTNEIEDLKAEYNCLHCNLTEDEFDPNHFCIKFDNHGDKQNEVTCKLKPRGKLKNIGIRELNRVNECFVCKKIFDKRYTLIKHINQVHKVEKNYYCVVCNKRFKQLFHLREHMHIHTGEFNFTCPFCDKKFQRRSSLSRHKLSHEKAPGNKTKKTPFLCTVCGKSFPFSNGVQRHMRVHLGIRNHECNICQRKFTQSTHLHVHMRTHTGEKPYICDSCGESFSLKASLHKHMTIHTRENQLNIVLSE